jgi:hypothetical protein
MTMTITPFTFVNAVNDGKDIEVTPEYSQYLMNRNFSMFQDTIYIANQTNAMTNVTNDMHFKYLRSLVSRRKRFARWPKGHSSDVINMISAYYDFSLEKTLEALNILTDEQIEKIKEWYAERNE